MASKNKALAQKIIKKFGYLTKEGAAYRAGIKGDIAFETYIDNEKKKVAQDNLQKMLEYELDNGNIILADDWEAKNL